MDMMLLQGSVLIAGTAVQLTWKLGQMIKLLEICAIVYTRPR